ncbi:MAG: hypothetical protein ACO1N9_01460 [Flavobacterium sp.]
MENISAEIERHEKGIKRIKNVIPLVTVVIISVGLFGFRFSDSTREARNSWLILGAMVMYCSSFVLAYYTHKRKIKKLQQQL